MSGAQSVFSAPIAADADSLPGSLDQVAAELWTRIARGLDGRWPPWALPTVTTVSKDGAPRPRVLALRQADRDARRFTFHTDARSDKVADVVAEPRVSLLFWDPTDAIQARVDGLATLHRGDQTAAVAWAGVSALRKHGCSVSLAPGAPLAGPERFDRLSVLPADAAVGNFAVLEVEALAIDWLWLGPHDMRRARFAWTGTRWSAAWVAP